MANPTALEIPCPKGPVETSTPEHRNRKKLQQIPRENKNNDMRGQPREAKKFVWNTEMHSTLKEFSLNKSKLQRCHRIVSKRNAISIHSLDLAFSLSKTFSFCRNSTILQTIS